MESAFELKAAAAAAAAAADGAAKLVEEKQQQQQRQQQQQQRYLYPCLAQLASGIQEREQQTLRAIRSCIR